MEEKRVPKYSLPVDGYCSSTNRVHQFDRCFFHGYEKCSTNRDYSGNLKETNSLTGKKHQRFTKSNTGKHRKDRGGRIQCL